MERYYKRKATVDLSWPSKRGGGSTNELGELASSLQTEVQEMGEAVGISTLDPKDKVRICKA
ncbi:hypothetical protein C5167_031392 [Papaver somniferum]|uniref:Uncharacterized protein n=1 Tax=Papaver somniferum TaxID=3469 RepID=A0A4Y7K7E2_PAPSO|nr:hypothetical protein C5167_031392 [Papaver somniferum]